MQRINLNDHIIVTPTERGWGIWRNHYRRLGLRPPSHSESLQLSLWEWAQIFGGALYNGCDMPFDGAWMTYVAKCDDNSLAVALREIERLRAEVERLRGLIKTYRNMLRYDWIAQQDKKIKELSAEIDALRGEGEK